MKEKLKKLAAKVEYAVLFPIRPVLFFHEIRKSGHYEVITTFDYELAGRTETYGFRTLIELDVDWIDFLPPINRFIDNPEWMRLCMDAYREHRGKITDFGDEVLKQERVWGLTVDITAIAASLQPIYATFQEFNGENSMLTAAWLSALVFGRRWLRKKGLSYVKKGIFWIAQKYLMKKIETKAKKVIG